MEVATREKRKLSDFTFDEMATVRNKLSEQIKEADLVVAAIKAKREKVDVEFLRRFNEQGIQNVKTKHGTPHIIKRESYSVADKPTYIAWCKATGNEDFMEIRASKSQIDVYKAEHEEIPPGINYSAKLTIGVTK